MPLEGSISYAELSKKTGLDEIRLVRIVRYAMLMHIFTEPNVLGLGSAIIRERVWMGLFITLGRFRNGE